MSSWWSDHPDLEGIARRGRRELHDETVSAERDTDLLRKRRRSLIDVCHEWMSRGDLVTVGAAGHEFEGQLVAAVNDLIVIATKNFEVAVNVTNAEFARRDQSGMYAGTSGDRTVGSFRAALGRSEVDQTPIRLVGRNDAFDITGTIEASTEDHILIRGRRGLEWALPRSQVAFAVGGPPTTR